MGLIQDFGIIQEWSLTMAPPPSSACSAHCPSPHCEHHVVWASRPIRHLTQTCSHSAHTHTHKAITLPFKGPLHSGDRSSPPLPFHPSGFSNKRARPRRHRIVGESRQPSGHMLSQCPPTRSLSPSSRTLTPPRVSWSVAVTQVERRPTGCFLFGVSASVGS